MNIYFLNAFPSGFITFERIIFKSSLVDLKNKHCVYGDETSSGLVSNEDEGGLFYQRFLDNSTKLTETHRYLQF